jgi:K+ transporter
MTAPRYTTSQIKARAFKRVMERTMWTHLNRINAIVFKHMPKMTSPARVALLRELNQATATTVVDTVSFLGNSSREIDAAVLSAIGAGPEVIRADDNVLVEVVQGPDGKIGIVAVPPTTAETPVVVA